VSGTCGQCSVAHRCCYRCYSNAAAAVAVAAAAAAAVRQFAN